MLHNELHCLTSKDIEPNPTVGRVFVPGGFLDMTPLPACRCIALIKTNEEDSVSSLQCYCETSQGPEAVETS